MFGKGRKRRTGRISTVIGRDAEIVGDVAFTGGLHIDGRVKGNVVVDRVFWFSVNMV